MSAIGVNGSPRTIKDAYIGVNGVARPIKEIYIGNGGPKRVYNYKFSLPSNSYNMVNPAYSSSTGINTYNSYENTTGAARAYSSSIALYDGTIRSGINFPTETRNVWFTSTANDPIKCPVHQYNGVYAELNIRMTEIYREVTGTLYIGYKYNSDYEFGYFHSSIAAQNRIESYESFPISLPRSNIDYTFKINHTFPRHGRQDVVAMVLLKINNPNLSSFGAISISMPNFSLYNR